MSLVFSSKGKAQNVIVEDFNLLFIFIVDPFPLLSAH